MNRNTLLLSLRLFIPLVLLWLVGCTPTPASSPSSDGVTTANRSDPATTINLAQAANLATATQIEIRTWEEESGAYQPTTTITDPTVITTLTAPLDQELPLQPALFCTAQYELIFQVAEGKTLTFHFACAGEEGAYLQEGETPLQDRSIEAPAAFHELLTQQMGSQ